MMVEDSLIASVRAGDIDAVRRALSSGADLRATDEHGWTALCWAAGGGQPAIVQALLEAGADVLGASGDARTPYQIAVAAGRVETARLLALREAAIGGESVARSSGQASRRPYCRAYHVKDLRAFPGWRERTAEQAAAGAGARADGAPPDAPLPDAALPDDAVVFLHRDFSVTRSSTAGEEIVCDDASAEWRRFCTERLAFAPPDDFTWLPATPAP